MINTDFIVLEVAVRERRLQLDHRLRALARDVGVECSGVAATVVRAVLSAAQRLGTVLLRVLVDLSEGAILEQVDNGGTLADAAAEMVGLVGRGNAGEQGLREGQVTRRCLFFHI